MIVTIARITPLHRRVGEGETGYGSFEVAKCDLKSSENTIPLRQACPERRLVFDRLRPNGSRRAQSERIHESRWIPACAGTTEGRPCGMTGVFIECSVKIATLH